MARLNDHMPYVSTEIMNKVVDLCGKKLLSTAIHCKHIQCMNIDSTGCETNNAAIWEKKYTNYNI